MSRESRALDYGLEFSDHERDQIARSFVADSLTGCWVAKNVPAGRMNGRAGYPAVLVRGRRYTTHRLMWVLTHGPIPATWDVDHLCRNTRCVNPAHLEAVTHAENIRRGKAA